MTTHNPIEQYHTSVPDHKAIILLLALHAEPLSKTRLLEYLRSLAVRDAGGKPFTASSLAETMSQLRHRKFVTDVHGSGFTCTEALQMPAIRAALDDGSFEPFCKAIDTQSPIQMSYDGAPYLRTYRQGLARLRMALLRGQPPQQVYPWLAACARFLDLLRFRLQHA